MTKIVFNNCFGGFSLSEKAILRYGELKGWTLHIEYDKWRMPTYWKVPPDQRPHMPEGADERVAANQRWGDATLYDRDIPRDDPVLVQVIEELGSEANGQCAKLAIAEVPNGARYRIDEYDGNETVMTPDDYDWKIA